MGTLSVKGLKRTSWLSEIIQNDTPVDNYMFEVNNRNITARCEICSKLTIKTPERCYWRRSGVFIVNSEHISLCSSVSVVNFEQVNAH